MIGDLHTRRPSFIPLRKPASDPREPTILVLPITLGTVLIAEGLLTYLGPQGWVNRLLIESGLASSPIRLTHRAA